MISSNYSTMINNHIIEIYIVCIYIFDDVRKIVKNILSLNKK